MQSSRAGLVLQYNKIIEQIVTTSQDASFNGVNLLAGDTLKLVFNETGKSVLNIQGVNFTPAGLGLGSLTTGTDFIDNNATNVVLTALNGAGSSLRSQAAALGSNLSIVQIRQEFSKNLINVLQTGSANLTLADTNEEGGEQPGAGDPSIDCGVRAGAGQPVAAERAAAAAVVAAKSKPMIRTAEATPPFAFETLPQR